MATIDSLNQSISDLSFSDAQAMILQSRMARRIRKQTKKSNKTSKKGGKKDIISPLSASDKVDILAMLEGIELQ